MHEQTVIQSVATLAGLIALAVALRRLGVITAEHGSLFAGLVTKVTLPALIFLSLAQQRLTWDQASLALAMMLAEVVCLAVAWVAARLRRGPGIPVGRVHPHRQHDHTGTFPQPGGVGIGADIPLLTKCLCIANVILTRLL